VDNNIKIYDNFITEYEKNVLLNYAKASDDSSWIKIKHQKEELLKKSPERYNRYLQYVKDWDKTTLMITDHKIVEEIKTRCQEVIGNDLLITEDIYRIKRLTDKRSISTHFDDSQNFSLALGIVIYLNDNFDGGEIYYPNQDFFYKPKERSMIIHPATEEYTHGVKEVVGNTRYCLAFFATKY
jgi:hypothetical protein